MAGLNYYYDFQYEQEFWKPCYRNDDLTKVPIPDKTAHFVLFVQADWVEKVWLKIQVLTCEGYLGHVSKKCQNPMTYGRWETDTAITIHINPTQKEYNRVRQVLDIEIIGNGDFVYYRGFKYGKKYGGSYEDEYPFLVNYHKST